MFGFWMAGRQSRPKIDFFEFFLFRGISTFFFEIRLPMDQKEGAALIFIVIVDFRHGRYQPVF